MGFGAMNATTAATFTAHSTSAHVRSATTASAVSSSHFLDKMNPAKFRIRESRISAANPQPTPIILGLDDTGSMGDVALQIHKTGLATLCTEILNRKPVTDPHIAFAGIGDVFCDVAPLQFSQFESDETILEELKSLWMEGRGGGNASESYLLPHHLALTRTECDAFKIGPNGEPARKGFIFTFGDEEVPPDLTKEQLDRVYGPNEDLVLTNQEILDQLYPNWHVFHLIVEQGNHMRYGREGVLRTWKALLGQRAILLADYTRLAEVIISLMQVTAGADKAAVAASWASSAPGTDLVVAKALEGLDLTTTTSPAGSLVRF